MAQKDPVSPQDAFATALAASTALITAVGTAVGSATGVLNRTARDHPAALAAGYVIVFVAILMSVLPIEGVWPAYLNSRFRKFVLFVTPIAFVAGIAICSGTVLWTVGHPPQQLTLSGSVGYSATGETLDMGIKGGGFSSSDYVHVLVDASGATRDWKYQGTVGVDPNGSVDHPIKLTLPHTTYTQVSIKAWVGGADSKEPSADCPQVGMRESCLTFNLKPAAPRPQIVAVYTPGPNQAVKIDVSATEVGDGQSVALIVRGDPSTRTGDPVIYSTILRADAEGTVKVTISVPVGSGYRDICVLSTVALTAGPFPLNAETPCPPSDSTDVVWALIALP